jgi:hypothetical protein
MYQPSTSWEAAADSGFLMDKDLDARWCKRGAIEIESSMGLGPGRQTRVELGAM